jgi:hypothetical protein
MAIRSSLPQHTSRHVRLRAVLIWDVPLIRVGHLEAFFSRGGCLVFS